MDKAHIDDHVWFSSCWSFVDICSLKANGGEGRVSEIVWLYNQNPFYAFRIDCLEGRKGRASYLSYRICLSLVTAANERKHCTICFVLWSSKSKSCNRTRHVRGRIYMFKILSWVSDFLARALSGKHCVVRQTSNSQQTEQELRIDKAIRDVLNTRFTVWKCLKFS